MQNEEIIGKWGESAPYWEKYRAVITEMFALVTQALIEDAGIVRGSVDNAPSRWVLDIATGTGEPALTIADLIGSDSGSGGTVVGTDVAPEMLEAARREAERRKLSNARFELAFTDNLPFAANTFDVAVSRFGAMFFPSPIDCLREVLRVVKPGGKIAMAVWSSAERNPIDSVVSQVVDRYVEPTPAKPGTSDMFRFAKPGDLLAILSSAGATGASERVLQFAIRAGLCAEDFWTLRSEMSEKLRTKLAMLSEPQKAALRLDAIEAIRTYSVENGVSFPAEVLIVSGRKPVA